MAAINNLKTVLQRAKTEDCLSIPSTPDKKLPLSRACRTIRSPVYRTENDSRVPDSSGIKTKIGTDVRIDADFRFLKSNAVPPLVARLTRELAETVRVIRQDPLAFIRANLGSRPIPNEKRKRMRAGITIAIAFYAFVLSGIYASYAIFHRVKPSAAPAKQLEITYLGSPPMPVTKAMPQLREASGRISKGQLTTPIKSEEQPKAELVETKPTPRPPDQTLSRTDPTTQNPTALSGPDSSTSETASRASASDGAARGLTGNGVGTVSDDGRGGASGVEVNYNDIFTVSNVTIRPQILARPVPGYTEEARRAQVDGVVKLSVVLNTNGTVSDIRVTRGLGYGLDEKAIEAARELRFTPAQKDGHLVSVRVFLEFKFTLL
jgi:TonB family protein